MAGITNLERERRQTERVLATAEMEFRDPGHVVIYAGPLQRGYCEPCRRRDWGAQIRIGRGDVFRCCGCLQVMATTLSTRAQQQPPDHTAALALLAGDAGGLDRMNRIDRMGAGSEPEPSEHPVHPVEIVGGL
jgi:hypothetical protein